MPDTEVLSIRGVLKDYRGLRPLRIAELALHAGESVALLGLDQAMAEVLVRLIMGASLPDSGEVVVFGQSTAAVETGDAWLDGLHRFALLGDRALLVDRLTAEQTLAMPISFDVNDPAVREAVRRLADEVGLPPTDLHAPTAELSPLARVRLRLGRALAGDPGLLLAEHPTASLSAADTSAFAADVSRVVRRRRLSTLTITADATFAAGIGDRVLTLRPATGELAGSSGRRRWFG